MSEYYAVERTGDSLAHYGIKGIKWGVRKAIQSGNAKALGRQFRKAEKKLAKLEKRGANGKKYAKRAAKLGVAGAALGAAGALGSFQNINVGAGKLTGALNTHLGHRVARQVRGGKLKNIDEARNMMASSPEKGIQRGLANAVNEYNTWGSKKLSDATGAVTRHGAIRIGTMAAGAGLAGAAGYNAYRAATAKRNRQKAAQFRSEMQKAFKGTQYANQMPAQYTPKQKKRKKSNRG